MGAYILRRLLLMVPTLFGIMTVNFLIIQAAPGGPVERTIAAIQGFGTDATERVSGSGMGETLDTDAGQGSEISSKYRGAQGLDPELIAELERLYGFDKPVHERFLQMIGQYVRFDFGESFYRDQRVVDLVKEKMPVSISLGLWTTLLVYFISIPLGIAKAVRDGSRFDIWTSGLVIVGYAIPSFLFAILLIVVFAGGHYLDWFPLRGLTSSNWDELTLFAKIADYFWHLALPVAAMVIGGFAGLTLLTKNSFLDEINKLYVTTARAKGLSENRVLYGHVLPQRHADRHRRLPQCFCRYLLHRCAADGNHLLVGRVGLVGLRGGYWPRLPGDVRHAVLLHVARPADAVGGRFDLHAGRSPH